MTDNNVIVGALGGIAAIIGAAKWIADSFKEWRLGREVKYEEVKQELDKEKAYSKRLKDRITDLDSRFTKLEITMSAVVPILKQQIKNDPEAMQLLDLLQENVTPAKT